MVGNNQDIQKNCTTQYSRAWSRENDHLGDLALHFLTKSRTKFSESYRIWKKWRVSVKNEKEELQTNFWVEKIKKI